MFKFWGTSLVAAGVVLFASAAFAADDCDTDYNGDGVTDAADIEILQAALGSLEGDEAFVAQADHNGDGEITVLDYGILLSCN